MIKVYDSIVTYVIYYALLGLTNKYEQSHKI